MIKERVFVGFLILTILVSGIIYVQFEDVKIRVDNDKSTFYVLNENSRWEKAGVEYNSLFDGTSKMNRMSSEITVTQEVIDNQIKIVRITPYIRGPIIIDTYLFDGQIDDVELFPISHQIEVINGQGYFYRYDVKDLSYSGESFKLDGQQTSQSFGLNMKVDWWQDYRLGWIYKNGNMYVKSEKIDSDYQVFNVRLFDPIITIPYDSDDINITQEAAFAHANLSISFNNSACIGTEGCIQSYWPFDVEESGVRDYSDNSYDGTLQAGASYTDEGYFGKGIDFDGTNDFIQITTANQKYQSADRGTIMMWVNMTSASTISTLFSSSNLATNYMHFFIRTDQKLAFQHVGSGATDQVIALFATSVPLNTWAHVAVTSSGTSYKLYLNGNSLGLFIAQGANSGDWFDDLSTANHVNYLGKLNSVNQFNGTMDEVQIYSFELNVTQINDIINEQSSRFANPAIQTFRPVNITEGDNRINVSQTFNNNDGSNLSVRIGQINMTTNISGLNVYYPFEWQKGFDASINEIDYTLSGSTFEPNAGLNQSGGVVVGITNDAINLPINSFSSDSQGTIAFWANLSDVGVTTKMFSSGTTGDEFFIFSSNGDLRFQHTGPANDLCLGLGPNLVANEWNHIALTSNGTSWTLYRNGQVESCSYFSGSNTGHWFSDISGSIPITIGDGPGSVISGGTYDEFMVFDRELSGTEIESLYDETSEGKTKIYYTQSQNLTSGENITFTLRTPKFITIEDTYVSSNNFYTPNLIGDWFFETSFQNTPPTHSTPILNATDNPANTTNANLTAFNQSTFDFDGDSVKNIYNWYVDDQPLFFSHFPFEGGSLDGNSTDTLNATKDYSGRNNIINVRGAIWNSTGGYDGKGAYEFDGIDDRMLDFDSEIPVFQEPFTVSAWIKAKTFNDTVITQFGDCGDSFLGSDFSMGILSSGEVNLHSFIIFNYNSTQILNIGEWYQLTATYDLDDDPDVNLYINGVIDGGKDGPSIDIFPSSLEISGGTCGLEKTVNPFNGTIDEFKLYNRSLSSEQIQAIYNNQTNLIVSQETSVGEEWIVEITPNDGIEDGISKNSSVLTILADDVCEIPALGIDWIINGIECFFSNLNINKATDLLTIIGQGNFSLVENANLTISHIDLIDGRFMYSNTTRVINTFE